MAMGNVIIIALVVYFIVRKIRKNERERIERENQEKMRNYYQANPYTQYGQAQGSAYAQNAASQNSYQRTNTYGNSYQGAFRNDTPEEVNEEEAKDPELIKVNEALAKIDDEIDHAAYEIQRVNHDNNLTAQSKQAMVEVLQERVRRFRDQYSQLYMLKLQYKDAAKGNRAEAQRLINNMKDLVQAYDTLDGAASNDPFSAYDSVRGYNVYGQTGSQGQNSQGQRAQGRM